MCWCLPSQQPTYPYTMGNRRSHPAVVSYEEALAGLDADMLGKINQLFAYLKVRTSTCTSTYGLRRRLAGAF